MAQEEVASWSRSWRDRRRAEGSAASEGSQRRKERRARNSRRHGRRRSHAVRGRDLPHVRAVRGNARLEGGSHLVERVVGRRPEGSHRAGQRRQGLQPLKYEGGVHRVQRVPATEQQGRVNVGHHGRGAARSRRSRDQDRPQGPPRRHVLFLRPGRPERQHDLFGRRITHLPTGRWSPARTKNRRSRIAPRPSESCGRACMRSNSKAAGKNRRGARRPSSGLGRPGEKSAPYNFPQNRVTDHRIGFTLHQLDLVMEGKLDQFVDALNDVFQTRSSKSRASPRYASQGTLREWIYARLYFRARNPSKTPGSPYPG